MVTSISVAQNRLSSQSYRRLKMPAITNCIGLALCPVPGALCQVQDLYTIPSLYQEWQLLELAHRIRVIWLRDWRFAWKNIEAGGETRRGATFRTERSMSDWAGK